MNDPLKNCDDNHETVYYRSKECPVCVVRLQMDEVLDGRTDIDEDNIEGIFGELKQLRKDFKHLQKRIDRLERQNGVFVDPSLKDQIVQVFSRKP